VSCSNIFVITGVYSLLFMTKKNVIVLTITLVSVIGFYLYLFRDSFHKPVIQISHTIRPNPTYIRHPPQGASAEDLPQLINFGLSGEFKLTSVKVVSLAELETNKYAHPLWELVSDSNSARIPIPPRSAPLLTAVKSRECTLRSRAQPLIRSFPM
jgi:hypothetical protein